jgi:thiol-disulfide isomerase/thioredoxin
MKKLFIIPTAVIALSLTFSSCKKEEASTDLQIQSVSSKYKPVVFEYSATWCGPCGQYGYPAMHELMADYQYKVTGVFLHPQDDIISTEPAGQEDIIAFFQWSGTPSAAVNAGPDTYPTYLEPKVTQALNANPTAKGGIGIAKKIDGNTLTVKTQTVFFDAVSGNYNLAIYVTESKIMETQNSQTGIVEHNNILQAIANGNAFGTLIASNPTKGMKVDGEYSITLPSSIRNKDNVHVVAVLYAMDASGNPTAVLNSNEY